MYLFFYGILQGDVAMGQVRDLLVGIGPGIPAVARGKLYVVSDPEGSYPAMVEGEGEVHGLLHDAGSVDVDALDEFEGSQYRRGKIEVAAGDRRILAEAYLWDEPVEGLERIEHGSFGRWLREHGRHPWSH